jgi:single-strand DNA-binding protein
MSNDVNTVVLVGRLAADPELRQAGSTDVLRMRLAVSRDRKQLDGSWKEQPHFFNVDLIGNRAEGLSRHLAKGSRIVVQGHLEFRQWTANDGSKRSAVQVFAENVNFADAPQQRMQTRDQDRAERYERERGEVERRDVELVPDRSDVPADEDEDSEPDIPFVWRPYVPRVHAYNPFA